MKRYFNQIIQIALLIILSSHLSYASQYHDWDNEEAMTPYFSAISFIGSKFEPCLQQQVEDVKSDFISWPILNPTLSRTPRYLFLETVLFNDQDESLAYLYTPFGEVQFFESGWLAERISCSKLFLQEMHGHWEIEDVSDFVELYHYFSATSNSDFGEAQFFGSGWLTGIISYFKYLLPNPKEKLYGPYKYEKHPVSQGNGVEKRLYLIKNINGYAFVNDNDVKADQMIVYASCSGYYESTKKIFSKLSGGLNRF